MARYLSFLTVLLVVLLGFVVQPDTCLAQWMQDGAPICTAVGDQLYPRLVSDGNYGAIIVWYDDRSGNEDIYSQRVDGFGSVLWSTTGVAICTETGGQWHPHLISDGDGGAIIVWEDDRITGDKDIYAQRVDPSGNALWTEEGVEISTIGGHQRRPRLVSDGVGGAIIAWDDGRLPADLNIYAQRVNADSATLWATDGKIVCDTAGTQRYLQLVSDEAGGAIIAWNDFRSDEEGDVYTQRVDSSGNALWTDDGVAICTTTGGQSPPTLVSDGAGGAIIAWTDERSGERDIYAQRVNADGDTLWATNGVAVCTTSGLQSSQELISDGGGGAIIAWRDHSIDGGDIYAELVDSSGKMLWEIVPICTAAEEQINVQLASDGNGGAFFAWTDFRNGGIRDIYAQRVDASGTVLWDTNGVAICTAAGGQDIPWVVSDGAGGAVITWHDGRSHLTTDIYAQRVGPEGQTGGWPTITNIEDVPNDQGEQVTIRWIRSGMDASPLKAITHYSIWRSLLDGKLATLESAGARQVSPAEVSSDFSGPGYRVTTVRGSDFYWEWIANQPAHYFPNYSYTAATLFDVDSTTPGWHYFLVSAHTSDPFIFWDSEIDSGYSVNNLAPSPPQGLEATCKDMSIELVWNGVPDEELCYYLVYRSSNPNSDYSNPLATSTDTIYTDFDIDSSTTYYYRVAALDSAENRSDYSNQASCSCPVGIHDNRDIELPKSFSLSQNHPNPFNPTTEIKYVLPKDCWVKLEIYDVLGQKVATLVDGTQKAGYKTARWNAGSFSSGIYFYRLQAGGFLQTRKMVLIR